MSTTKTVFQFDIAGLFTGSTLADESPLEPGVFLMPARTTEVPPPNEWPADAWPRWNGRAWALVVRPALPEARAPAEDPVAKLRAFLAENPDVAAIL